MIFLNIIITVLCALLLIPLSVFAVECFFAILPWRRVSTTADAPLPRTAVLIPAHNEATVIEPTLRSLLPTLSPGDRTLVIADNCSDETAALAKAAGAEVVERCDATNLGKGHALQFGLEQLRKNPPDVVVVLDADCLAMPGAVRMLSQKAWKTGRPVQSLNLTDREPATTPLQSLAILANRLTNLVRPLGLQRMGLPCRLMGTGMAIPWPIARTMQFAGGNLVEDLQLGIDLALQGHWPVFCPAARVTSALPPHNGAYLSQRKRWEHGQLQTTIRRVPPLLLWALLQHDLRLLTVALDLCIPPLALIAVVWCAMMAATALAGLLGASWIPAMLTAFGGLTAGTAFFAAWFVHCRRYVAFSALIAAPRYIARKSPIYLGFFFHGQRRWVRTERKAESNSDAIRHDQGHGLQEDIGAPTVKVRL